MIASGYDLQLECDGEGCHARPGREPAIESFTGELGADCRRRARKAGWVMYFRGVNAGRCLCPSCVARGAQLKSE
jgi:hypothetical protein